MKKYKPKQLKFKHICTKCNTEYLSADIKGLICKECKEKKKVLCDCGCGIVLNRATWQINKGKNFKNNHQKRGKTYKEIYGTDNPGCGYQKGDKNIMSNPVYIEKVRKGVTLSYTPELREVRRQQKLKQLDNGFVYGKMLYKNNRGEKYRSILELDFAELLFMNNISYIYEPKPFKLLQNIYKYQRKIVDFEVNEVLIEITGVAYKTWEDQFIIKINLLKQVTEKKILIITYPEKVQSLSILLDERTFVLNYFEISANINILNNNLNK